MRNFLYRNIIWKITALSTIMIIITAQKAIYENYKVFRVTPITIKQMILLRQLTQFRDRVSTLFRYMCKHQKSVHFFCLRKISVIQIHQ